MQYSNQDAYAHVMRDAIAADGWFLNTHRHGVSSTSMTGAFAMENEGWRSSNQRRVRSPQATEVLMIAMSRLFRSQAVVNGESK